jgi:hypothetical protein
LFAFFLRVYQSRQPYQRLCASSRINDIFTRRRGTTRIAMVGKIGAVVEIARISVVLSRVFKLEIKNYN